MPSLLPDRISPGSLYDVNGCGDVLGSYLNSGQEVDLDAEPGVMMIKLSDIGEDFNAARDTHSLIAIGLEEWVNDPEDFFNFTNEQLLGLLDIRAFNNTAGNIAVQNK